MLASIHNLHYYLNLMREMREALDAGTFAAFAQAVSSGRPGTRGLKHYTVGAAEQLRDLLAQSVGIHAAPAESPGQRSAPRG